MKLGLALGWHALAWEDLQDLVRRAEAAGFAAVYLDGDVSMLGRRHQADVLDGWTVTTAILARTLRIQVGSIRLVHHWNAAKLAQAEPGAFAAVPIQAAYASFAQDDYPVSGAIDPDVNKGWGEHLRNTDHEAWFLPSAPFGAAAGSLVRIRMRFESVHAEHQIGRFRVEVANGPVLREARFGPGTRWGPS